MKNLVKILAVSALVVPTMANAQNVETVPGPYLTTTPSSPYGLQNYRYGCDNTTPTSGHCWPLLQIYDGTNLGVVNPNGQATANNSTPVVLPSAQITTDPCSLLRKTTVSFSITSASITQLVAPVPLDQVFICAIIIKPTAVDTVSVFGGLGATCATGTPLSIIGSVGASLSAGMDLSGLGDGVAQGNGSGSAYSTTTAGHGICFGHTATTKEIVSISYVQMQ